MIQNLAAFVVAAILEILGCFTFWLWLRRGASPAIAALGIRRTGGALPSRHAGRSGIAKPPLPEAASAIAGALQHFGDSDVIVSNRDRSGVRSDGCVPGVQPAVINTLRDGAQTVAPA